MAKKLWLIVDAETKSVIDIRTTLEGTEEAAHQLMIRNKQDIYVMQGVEYENFFRAT